MRIAVHATSKQTYLNPSLTPVYSPAEGGENKMKTISCKDLGSDMCPFAASAETVEEIIKILFDHAAKDHPDISGKMTDKDKKDMEHKIRTLFSKQQ